MLPRLLAIWYPALCAPGDPLLLDDALDRSHAYLRRRYGPDLTPAARYALGRETVQTACVRASAAPTGLVRPLLPAIIALADRFGLATPAECAAWCAAASTTRAQVPA